MNLTVVTQALNGGVTVQDPVRDRELKRIRRQISESISGIAIGVAILIVALVAYALIPYPPIAYSVTLVLALFGLIKLFRNIGNILDTKVGNKLLDPAFHNRSTGNLNSTSTPGPPTGTRMSGEYRRPVAPTARVSATGNLSKPSSAPLNTPSPPPSPSPARVNREHSTPLRKLDFEEEILSRLRN
jgi:hypothetical protein